MTEKQAGYIRSLLSQLGTADVDQAFTEVYSKMDRREASAAIDGLLRLRAEGVSLSVTQGEPEPMVPATYALPEGYFTVVLEAGGHRTFRVREVKGGKLSGRRIISYLAGSNNESDYVGFGFVNTSGVSVWKRFASESTLRDALDILLGDHVAAQLGYAMESGNCYRCGRLLTDPESITLGIGPVCREM